MSEKLEAEITKLVSEIIEVPVDKLDPDADFINTLDVDSMRALEVVAAIEKKYKTIIPEEEIRGLRTLNKILALVKRLIKA
jgi:acyl carrier protein